MFKQAHEQVLEQQLDIDRLHRKLMELQNRKRIWKETRRPSPLAVPIWAEMNSARLSTESFHDRMERMKKEWTQVT